MPPKITAIWHSLWLMKCFDWQRARFSPQEFHHIYTDVLCALSEAGILHKVSNVEKGFSNFGINPTKLAVSTEVCRLQCAACYHKIVAAQQQVELWHALPLSCCSLWRKAMGYKQKKTLNKCTTSRIYEAGEVERIFAYEHTGLLGRKQREKIEAEFKSNINRRADAINLLSCKHLLWRWV